MISLSQKDLLRQVPNSTTIGLPFLVWFLLLFQRIAINIRGYQVSIGFVVFLLFIFFWLTTKKVFISPEYLLLFLLTVTGILTSALISTSYSKYFSIPSLLLVIVLYLPSIFKMRGEGQIIVLLHFRNAMLFCSLLGILHFLTQFLGVPFNEWLEFIPKDNIFPNFNYNIPLEYGSNFYKANGIFFLEPSFFSQFLSLAIIIELYLFHKFWRVLFLLSALLLTFSGTGLILLFLSLLPMIVKFKWKQLLALGFITILIILLFYLSGFSHYTSDRISEFQNPATSGYIRFITPLTNYTNLFFNSETTLKLIFGLGPGSSNRFGWGMLVEPNLFFKLIVEYGIFGLFFLCYLIKAFFTNQPFWLSLSCFFMFSILSGGSVLLPQIVVIIYVILFLHGCSFKSYSAKGYLPR